MSSIVRAGWVIGMASALGAVAARVSGRVTYTYDARGRLVKMAPRCGAEGGI